MNEEKLQRIMEMAGYATMGAVLELDRPLSVRVDIDGTICTRPKGSGYDQSRPIPERITFFNELHARGWRIVYWTSRGARSGEDYSELTVKQLTQWGCKYDAIKCDKPAYDLIIDDLAVNADSLFGDRQDATDADGQQSPPVQAGSQ